MSDNWIILVPSQPDHVPPPDRTEAAAQVLKALAPNAAQVEITVHDHVQLIDCAGNFETVSCPHCMAELDRAWWGDTMSEDHDDGAGFRLDAYKLPCCATSLPLNALTYSFHQAFGRFELSAMNPDLVRLSDGDIRSVETALGCGVSVVYRHM